MQFNHLKPIFLGFFLLLYVHSEGQNAITSGGGTLTSENGIISYSVGQVSYQVLSCSDLEISQGVQQAFEITLISTIETVDIQSRISVFPNPTTEYLTIAFENLPDQPLHIELADLSGKVIYSKTILSQSSQIPVYSLSSGVYILAVRVNDKLIQSFKIIKNG